MVSIMLLVLFFLGGKQIKSSEPIQRNEPDGTRVEINHNIAGKEALK